MGGGNGKLAHFSDVEHKNLKKWKGTPCAEYSRKKECSEKRSSCVGFLRHSLSSYVKGAMVQGGVSFFELCPYLGKGENMREAAILGLDLKELAYLVIY